LRLNLLRILLIVLGLSGLATAALIASLASWAGWALNGHLWIAFSLGVFFTLALAGALMALLFYSARHGWDDRIERDADESS
jgi:hypothetical protein